MRYVWVIAILALGAPSAGAYPEFQVWVDQQTARNVNCAMCHSHGDGPDGVKPGQIGSLGPEQLEALNEARQAFDPGQEVDSPILNAFGNRIIQQLGRTGFIDLRRRPADFTAAYGYESDIDGDGIADAQEYVDGTLATSAHHGAPWSLFMHNLRTSWQHIVLIVMATALGLYGISNLLAWFSLVSENGTGGVGAADERPDGSDGTDCGEPAGRSVRPGAGAGRAAAE